MRMFDFGLVFWCFFAVIFCGKACLVFCLSIVIAVVSSVITLGWIGSHFLPEEQRITHR